MGTNMIGSEWINRALLSGLLAAGPLAVGGFAQSDTPQRAPGAPHRIQAIVPVVTTPAAPSAGSNSQPGTPAPDDPRGPVEVRVEVNTAELPVPGKPAIVQPWTRILPAQTISEVGEGRVITIQNAVEATKPLGQTVEGFGTITLIDQSKDAPAASYWIGVQADPSPDVLRRHLGLSNDQGLSILQVVADSPAAKAGLQPMDVITTVEGKPVGEVSQLIVAIEAARENAIKGTLLRAGKNVDFAVIPTKRTDAAKPTVSATATTDVESGNVLYINPGAGQPTAPAKDVLVPRDDAPPEVKKWIAGHTAASGQIMATPQVIAFSAAMVALPDDVTVVVTRQGKQPTKIAVTKGDKHWEVTDTQLDQLPESVRNLVMIAMGPGPVPMTMAMSPPGGTLPSNGTFTLRIAPPAELEAKQQPGGESKADERKLRSSAVTPANSETRDEMILRRLDKIQRDVEALSREQKGDRR